VKDVNFEEYPLHIPLVNIMSSVDDLRTISKKTEEVQELIRDQETKHNEKFYMVTTSWGNSIGYDFCNYCMYLLQLLLL
jgi:hypothetical protein